MWEKTTAVKCSFSASHRGAVLSKWPVAGDVNLDRLAKVGFARVFHIK